MPISSNQFAKKDILKAKYEILSEVSYDDFYQHEYHLQFLYNFFEEYLGFDCTKTNGSIKSDGSYHQIVDGVVNSIWHDLSLQNVENLLETRIPSSLDLLRGSFEPFEYQEECLAVLSLLKENGVAYFYIPSVIYRKIAKDLKKQNYYINAIFGENDERHKSNPVDQKNVLPLHCKYIALYISKVRTKHLFIWTEMYDFSSLVEELYDFATFKKVLSNKSKLTKKNMLYEELVSKYNPIVYSSSKFIDIENFYYTAKKASLTDDRLSKITEIKLNECTELIINDSSYGVVRILENLTLEDNELKFDKNLFDSKIKSDDASADDFSGNIKDLMLSINRGVASQNYKKNIALEYASDLLIIETIKEDYQPPYIEITHPKDWEWGEYEWWQASDSKRKIVLISIKDIYLEFLIYFLNSETGLINTNLALINSKEVFNAWKDIRISLPSIEEQKTIVSALNSSKVIKARVNSLEKNLIQNPLNASDTDQELKEMVSRLEMLSESDQIAEWISRRGNETDQIEFKETLMLDIKTQTSEKRLETSSFKTLVGFINNNGGSLVVGVSDSGEVNGMEHELIKFHKDSHDKFKITFGNKITKRIGKEFLNNLSYDFILIKGKYVFRIKCTKSKNKCFLDGEDYYVRRHAYTEKLAGPELIKYIEEHYDPEKWIEDS